MNDYDYIISIDESGSPYLEHAFGLGKGSQKQNHKYYTRVSDKGRWRYFYSPEEFRVWSQGGRGKKQSTSDKMKNEFKKLKDAGKDVAKKAVEKAKDIAGFDERDAAAKAWSKVPKSISSSDKSAMKAFKEADEAQRAYQKTPLGKVEYLSERAKEIATGQDGTVKDIADKALKDAKSKFDRMKDEFKKKEEKTESKSDESENAKKIERPASRKKSETIGTAKEGSMNVHTSEKSSYSEYKKGDRDFDDDNYKEENRVGDTDFFVHTRKDGTNVILEEDMKWVLPKGIDAKSPEIQKVVKDFASADKTAKLLGDHYTNKQWTDAVSKALDDAIRTVPISNKSNVSKEYMEDLEFNSRKNNYFGR